MIEQRQKILYLKLSNKALYLLVHLFQIMVQVFHLDRRSIATATFFIDGTFVTVFGTFESSLPYCIF
jgi:hypothetical protein